MLGAPRSRSARARHGAGGASGRPPPTALGVATVKEEDERDARFYVCRRDTRKCRRTIMEPRPERPPRPRSRKVVRRWHATHQGAVGG